MHILDCIQLSCLLVQINRSFSESPRIGYHGVILFSGLCEDITIRGWQCSYTYNQHTYETFIL